MSIADAIARKENLAATGLLALFFLVTLTYIRFYAPGLSADEAYYWDWSRRLDWAYYSKPPMIAYVIRLGAVCFGASEAGLRAMGALLSTGSLALIWRIGSRFPQNPRMGLLALCLTLGMPDFWASASAIDTNKPLFFFWLLSLYALLRAVEKKNARWWGLLGVALGAGLLSKYTLLFLVIALLLYLLFAGRRWLRTPWPYLALLIMLLLNSGVFWWNLKMGWPSFIHTATLNRPETLSLGERLGQCCRLLESQFFPINPWLIPAFGYGLFRCYRQRRADRRTLIFLLAFFVPFLFYLMVSFDRPVLPHWPFPAYFAATLAAAWALSQEEATRPRAKRLLRGLSLVGASLLLLLATLTRTGILDDAPPGDRRVLNTALQETQASAGFNAPFICSNDRHLASLAAFYANGRPQTYCLNLGDRERNQYDLWGGCEKLTGRHALLLCFGDTAEATVLLTQLLDGGFFSEGEVLREDLFPEDYSDRFRPYCILGMKGFSGSSSGVRGRETK